MERKERFGDLLDEGISSVAKRQRKSVPKVEEEIALALGYSHHNVQRWRRGYIPQRPDQVAFLARYCVMNGRVNREWAASLLIQAGYLNREALLQELFPDRLPRTEIPRVYENLPPRYGDILGRQGDIARVLEGLERWPLVIIEGLGGVGKTTLAIEVARCCLSDFKAVVWVSAKNRPDQKRWLPEVLDVIARVLDYPYITQLSTAEKTVEVGKLLRTYRVLVIIDNFETMDDPDLEHWMQQVPEPSRVLITSRQAKQLFTVVVWDIHLHGLAKPEALDLIRRHARRLGLTRVETAAQAEILPLAQVTEGNPKAIEIALGHVKHGLSFSEVIDHLHAASKTIEDVFDYLFTHVWEILGEDPRCVLLVTPFFVDSANKETLAATAGLSGYTLDLALKQLVELSLLDVNEEVDEAKHRYSVHPLVRSFASNKLRNASDFEKQARACWCKYFLDFTSHHVVRDKVEHRYWSSLGGGGLTPIDPELPNLLNVLAWADQNEDSKTLIELMMLLVHYMDRQALYAQRLLYARKAAEAANRLGQVVDEAVIHIDALGWTLIEMGGLVEAEREIVTGLDIVEQLDAETIDAKDLTALAYAWLARIFLQQKDETKASELISKAMQIECRGVRDRVLIVAGELAHRRQEYEAAVEFYQESIRLQRQYSGYGDNDELHYRLGFVYFAQGDLAQAEVEFSVLLTATHPVGMIEAIYAKYGLARVAQAKGEFSQACQLAQDALEALSRLRVGHRLLKELRDFLADVESIDSLGR